MHTTKQNTSCTPKQSLTSCTSALVIISAKYSHKWIKKGSPQGSELFAKSSLRVCRTGLQRSLRGLDRIDAACRVESTAGLSTKPPSGANLVHRSLAVHLLHMHRDRGITVLRSPFFSVRFHFRF